MYQGVDGCKEDASDIVRGVDKVDLRIKDNIGKVKDSIFVPAERV